MKLEDIRKKLTNNESVYIRDDFEEMAIHLVSDKNDKSFCFIKFKGEQEYEIDPTSKLVFEIEMNGIEITSQEYKEY